jgi:hypothetical protein
LRDLPSQHRLICGCRLQPQRHLKRLRRLSQRGDGAGKADVACPHQRRL